MSETLELIADEPKIDTAAKRARTPWHRFPSGEFGGADPDAISLDADRC